MKIREEKIAEQTLFFKVIEEERLQENSLTVGTCMLNRLNALKLDHPNLVGEVRGKGLMIGLELVSNRATKTPLSQAHMLEIFEDIKNMRVLVGKGGLDGNVSHQNLDNRFVTCS